MRCAKLPAKTGKTKQQIARGKRIRAYGISETIYSIMLENQGHKCAICNKPESTGKALAIDHDHKTNEVRGLLCNKCNRGLGFFEDNEELLKQALKHLKTTKFGSTIITCG